MKRSFEVDSATRRSDRKSKASTHADGSPRQSYKQPEGIVHSEPESTVETSTTSGRPSRSKKARVHHDGTNLTVEASKKGGRVPATGFLHDAATAAAKIAAKKRRKLPTQADKEANEQNRVSAAAIEAAAKKKKVEDGNADAKADKEKKAKAEAEEQKRLSDIEDAANEAAAKKKRVEDGNAAAKAEKEKKAKAEAEEQKRLSHIEDAAKAVAKAVAIEAAAKKKKVEDGNAAAKADIETAAKERERVSAAALIESEKAIANVDEEESKTEGVPAAVAATENAAAAAAAAAANRKKIDNYFLNGRLKIGSKIDVYADRSQFIARTCVLKSVDEEGRTAQVVYDDVEDNELVPLDLMQDHYDIALLEEEESVGWAMENDTVGASSQSEHLSMLKIILHKLDSHKKGRKPAEPKRAIGTRAQSIPQMKDEVVRRAYDVLIKHTEQVQFISQFKSQDDRDYHPPFWTVLMNIDKLVRKPSEKGLGSRYEKAKPVVNMFAQKGIPVPELARILRNAAENMEKGITEGWTLESETEEFVTNTFGPRSNAIPAKQKSMVAAMQLEQEELEQIEEAAATLLLTAAATADPNQNQEAAI
jgi:hypothetical protein